MNEDHKNINIDKFKHISIICLISLLIIGLDVFIVTLFPKMMAAYSSCLTENRKQINHVLQQMVYAFVFILNVLIGLEVLKGIIKRIKQHL